MPNYLYNETAGLVNKIEKYAERYEFSFQFWGLGNNNVFIEKDDVEIYTSGGHDTIKTALEDAVEYLDRINLNNYEKQKAN